MRLTLAAKISATLIGVVVLAVTSTIVAIVSSYRFEEFQRTLVVENLASVRAAEELEIALLEQRGYVSSYILDEGNPSWLHQLQKKREQFDHWLTLAHQAARSEREHQILNKLEIIERQYAQKRDEVVRLYDDGDREQARNMLLTDVVDLYGAAYDHCEAFIAVNQELVDAASARIRRQVEQVTIVVTGSLVVTVGLSAALMWFFFGKVLIPLRKIAAEARLATGDGRSAETSERGDELRELGHFVRLLMADVAETRSDLEQSRTQLAQADKLSAVGRLAASVAHEIRNPLTSMKMWLYSLRRSAGLDQELCEKLDIISEETVRLETIVRHFLEFARPPQLRLSVQDTQQIIEKTLELARHRLLEARVRVEREAAPELPAVMADAEQLRQVFINLIDNAAEAMPSGGCLRITAAPVRRGGRDMVCVRFCDTGTGMSEPVQRRMFEPFFTTKNDGSGLGLCIAASILARHGGALALESSTPQGTVWSLWIPAMEAAENG